MLGLDVSIYHDGIHYTVAIDTPEGNIQFGFGPATGSLISPGKIDEGTSGHYSSRSKRARLIETHPLSLKEGMRLVQNIREEAKSPARYWAYFNNCRDFAYDVVKEARDGVPSTSIEWASFHSIVNPLEVFSYSIYSFMKGEDVIKELADGL